MFSARPIEDLFEMSMPAADGEPLRSSADLSDVSAYASSGSWLDEEEVPLKYLRATARHDPDATARIEAIDGLADNASIALRTLRGLAEDPDPRVAAEAKRMLRELGVAMPEESPEAG